MTEDTAARPVQRIGVVGTGTMGRGIAQTAAAAGLDVRMFDAREGAVGEAQAAIEATLAASVAKGRLDGDAAGRTLARLTASSTIDALADCDLVVEAIVENIDAKQALFRRLESLLADDAILATNTSSLSVTAIATSCARPERVIGWHFFNPVPLMKIAEVVPGLRTGNAATQRLLALTAQLGHRAVLAQDTPGFVVNHAGRAFIPEGLRILSEGIATVDHIDAVLRDSVGFRMGPFELVDLIGLDNAQDVMRSLYHLHFEEPRFRITPRVAPRVAAGLLGRKTGEGFYRYDGALRAVAPTLIAPGGAVPPPVWIALHEPDLAAQVCALFTSTDISLEDGDTPSDQALIVVTPIGIDVSTACARWHLDAARTVGIDALFSLDQRCVLMAAPGFAPEWRARALAAFAATGRALTMLSDSPGFVSQRVVAQIVAIGCDMAQHRIATPADIDAAVMLGLGYPMGPFGFGQSIGLERILAISTALHEAYGDPRYRASIWLRRRALGGLALDHPD